MNTELMRSVAKAMKRPTPASLKKVTPENLARLGVERLSQLLAAAAATKPELKRQLRMELAADQGVEQLAPEIERRLASLAKSRSRVSWRQRPSFVRDLDALRELIVARLGALDRPAALNYLFQFMDVARQVGSRVYDRQGELAAVFQRASEDLGGLVGTADPRVAAGAAVDLLVRNPHGWALWLPKVLEHAPEAFADAALRVISERSEPAAALTPLIRQLADAASNVEAYCATFTPAALRDPSVAAEVAQRLLRAGRIEEAGRLLEAAEPRPTRGRSAVEGDFDWEGAWIDYLEATSKPEAAQAARWRSFERTLSVERARAFTSRLGDFDDVEAEARAFALAAAHPDLSRGLAFLMEWPALREAANMIEARANEIDVAPEQAEQWAARLRARHVDAAHLLLRKAAAAAFRRRDFKACDRLTEEADALGS